MPGFEHCPLCREWFDPRLGRVIGRRFVCAGCEVYLRETSDSDHPLGAWDVERAVAAALDAPR